MNDALFIDLFENGQVKQYYLQCQFVEGIYDTYNLNVNISIFDSPDDTACYRNGKRLIINDLLTYEKIIYLK